METPELPNVCPKDYWQLSEAADERYVDRVAVAMITALEYNLRYARITYIMRTQ